MNIQQIKTELQSKTGANLGTLAMVRQYNQTKPTEKEPWLSHWDNDKRVRITMHEDVFGAIKSQPDRADLAYKTEQVPASGDRAAYTRFVVITPKNIEGTF